MVWEGEPREGPPYPDRDILAQMCYRGRHLRHDPETRQHWIRTEAKHLCSVLAEANFEPEECERLATLMHDMQVDAPTGDFKPEQLIMNELLLMQGLDPATAGVVARVLPRLDWGKLELASRLSAEMLETSRVTLLRNRRGGRIPAKMIHAAGNRAEAVTYWLARLLFIRAWRRVHPWTGGPVSGFPPSD